MRLGFSTGDTVGRAGAILNVAKYLAELPAGSVIRNGCDSIDPEAAGTYLVKVPSTRSRAERDPRPRVGMVRSDHATGAHRPVEALGIAIVSVDVFLPVSVSWCLADFGIARYGEATPLPTPGNITSRGP
jgi:hypothetical protein